MNFTITPTALRDVLIIQPKKHNDARGFFMETYSTKALQQALGDVIFVQDNVSLSLSAGTVRGLHFQLPPSPQAKLVRVLQGAIEDVAIDVRANSPTFGQHVSVTLTADEATMLFIPIGFAHGFCTLQDNTQVFYKVSGDYNPQTERSIRWNDPDLAINWPIRSAPILSDKDAAAPLLKDLSKSDLF